MLTDSIIMLYRKLRLLNYKSIFFGVKERQGSLSATEAFSADTIFILGEPTVTEFADYIGISQPNATYKVNLLVQKGYIEKTASENDHRETHLKVSDKFRSYLNQDKKYVVAALERVKNKFTSEELSTASDVIEAVITEINNEEQKRSQ